ncbi:MAG: hypothetical protein EGR47_02215 [Clostridium sp.]|nr:hypothetical protein [Clostridium sp.]
MPLLFLEITFLPEFCKLLFELNLIVFPVLKIMSYIGIAHKQGYNAFIAIKHAISGYPEFTFE